MCGTILSPAGGVVSGRLGGRGLPWRRGGDWWMVTSRRFSGGGEAEEFEYFCARACVCVE